jgi:hypothetical protein
MSKNPKPAKRLPQRPERAKLSAKESLKRMEEFPKRKDQFVASIRKGKGLSA